MLRYQRVVVDIQLICNYMQLIPVMISERYYPGKIPVKMLIDSDMKSCRISSATIFGWAHVFFCSGFKRVTYIYYYILLYTHIKAIYFGPLSLSNRIVQDAQSPNFGCFFPTDILMLSPQVREKVDQLKGIMQDIRVNLITTQACSRPQPGQGN